MVVSGHSLRALEVARALPVGNAAVERCPLVTSHGEQMVVHIFTETFSCNVTVLPQVGGFGKGRRNSCKILRLVAVALVGIG